jgi:hypothetical protein
MTKYTQLCQRHAKPIKSKVAIVETDKCQYCAAQKKYYNANKANIRAWYKAYYAKKRGYLTIKCRQYNKANKDYLNALNEVSYYKSRIEATKQKLKEYQIRFIKAKDKLNMIKK